MRNRLSRRGRRASTLYLFGLVFACLVLSLGLMAVGCGGDETVTTADVTATELGKAIGATWNEAMQALNGLLVGQPEASTVKAAAQTLREKYIQKMVEFGKQRKAMDAAARTKADAALATSLSSAAGEDWYNTYMDNWDHYSYASGDLDFNNMLASFNQLQVYADFEQLKKTYPDEATRLGVE
jgi:hypothetical protein